MSRTILSDIKVVDFGRYVAGPYCASLLADFGADVIRVEPPGGGDDRRIAPVTDDGEGAIFLQVNRNKRGMTLDPRAQGGDEVVGRLVAGSDVVVVNAPQPALAKMGLDYETLAQHRPELVFVNISSFGSKGPWAARPGFDSIGQAMSGSAYLSGPGDIPYRTPFTWVDHATGLYAAFGVLLAIIERMRTGRGQSVEASLLGSALAFGSTFLIEQMIRGCDRTAIGNRSFMNGPTDTFRTRDGWIVTQVVGDALFRRWTVLIGEPELAEDRRFSNDQQRGDNGAALSAKMAAWCATRTSQEALDALAGARVPAGPVLSPQQAVDHPHVQAMGLIERTGVAGLEEDAPLLLPPVTMGGRHADIRTPPPRLGEHGAQILTELGFADEEQQALRRSGTI